MRAKDISIWTKYHHIVMETDNIIRAYHYNGCIKQLDKRTGGSLKLMIKLVKQDEAIHYYYDNIKGER